MGLEAAVIDLLVLDLERAVMYPSAGADALSVIRG